MGPEETMCEGCQKLTRTVFGKCPNCWYVKDPSVVQHSEYKPSGAEPRLGLFDLSNAAEVTSYILDGLWNAWW